MPPDYGIPQAFLKAALDIASQWYWWAFFLLIAAMKYGPGLFEAARLRKAGLPQVDQMSGLEFEKYLEQLFRRLGYHVERTPYVGDQGADLILTKNGERTLVQAKRHRKAIGNKAVQEAAAARPHYGCHRAMVVANQPFTRAARELAQSNQIDLWGRRELADAILSAGMTGAAAQAPQVARTRLAAAVEPTPIAPSRSATAVQPTAPTCARCGRPMVLRQSARGKFWGCSGFPKCRYTKEE